MTTRDLLERRLQTVKTLAAPGALQRGVDEEDGRDALENELTRQWKTEARLIRRILDEEGEPEAVLQTWRERTESFQERYPDRTGWTDTEGEGWHADLVLQAIENLLDHIENWSTDIELDDET